MHMQNMADLEKVTRHCVTDLYIADTIHDMRPFPTVCKDKHARPHSVWCGNVRYAGCDARQLYACVFCGVATTSERRLQLALLPGKVLILCVSCHLAI
jgi:hypothetical protein